jgi:hypothetical protein
MLLLLNRVNSSYAAVLSVVASFVFIGAGTATRHYTWIAMGATSLVLTAARTVKRHRAPEASA